MFEIFEKNLAKNKVNVTKISKNSFQNSDNFFEISKKKIAESSKKKKVYFYHKKFATCFIIIIFTRFYMHSKNSKTKICAKN